VERLVLRAQELQEEQAAEVDNAISYRNEKGCKKETHEEKRQESKWQKKVNPQSTKQVTIPNQP
jgi:hypothetical protein